MRLIKGSLVGLVLTGILAIAPPPPLPIVEEEVVGMVEALVVAVPILVALPAMASRFTVGPEVTTGTEAATGAAVPTGAGTEVATGTATEIPIRMIIRTTGITTTKWRLPCRPLSPCRRS
jgi:hypothetical protein